jgi:hypothetical protein
VGLVGLAGLLAARPHHRFRVVAAAKRPIAAEEVQLDLFNGGVGNLLAAVWADVDRALQRLVEQHALEDVGNRFRGRAVDLGYPAIEVQGRASG